MGIRILRNELLGKEMSFKDLDNRMMLNSFYSVFDDGVTKEIKQDKTVVYTSTVDNRADIIITFDITIDNAEDEAIEAFILKIKEIEEI